MARLGLQLLCLTFFALGVVHCAFPTGHAAKATQYYQKLVPNVSLSNAVFALGLLSLASSAALSAKPCLGTYLAGFTAVATMVFLGNPFLPVYNESEKFWALIMSYQALGILGAILLVKG
mmetsp:Transcript_10548/g.20289  ORF Transcript_10548/g.20289 Transcript_10548/m.20289 type:complete len:120 (-) Transcript_10548:2436-2795(-)